MRANLLSCLAIGFGLVTGALEPAAAEVSFTSPGLPPSRMDDTGSIVEDWGTVSLKFSGEGLPEACTTQVTAAKLEGIVPAAVANGQQGPVEFSTTAYRAPVWPAGLDVLTLRIKETAGRAHGLRLALILPETLRLGRSTASLGGRPVVALPVGAKLTQSTRDWGYADDAVSLPGWARPEVECDPAFRNIRAGMGGVPIHYQFKVEPKSKTTVVLGFCESHWDQPGQRPFVCEVEGAPPLSVDPLARWGRHKPGALSFAARDANGDGVLELSVLPGPGAPDPNPILNVIWLFAEGSVPNVQEVIAGRMNNSALRYVDVGGEGDQSLFAGGKIEYSVNLAPRSTSELRFLLACPGGSVPQPEQSAWTPEKLLKSAVEVWSQWK